MDRPAGLPAWVEPDLVLDADHAIEFTRHTGEDAPCGAIIWRRRPDKPEPSATPGWCAGGIFWREALPGHTPHAVWTLVSLDPLHVEPSILCSCGAHGFIRAGRWVPA